LSGYFPFARTLGVHRARIDRLHFFIYLFIYLFILFSARVLVAFAGVLEETEETGDSVSIGHPKMIIVTLE
jgi:hypothetical protein